MEYTLIRSKRKTVSLELKEDGVVVRAPLRMAKRDIDEFVRKHEHWIETHRQKVETRKALRESTPKLSEDELSALARQAADYIPRRVRFYADRMQAQYGRVTIRFQKTRWGSCSAKKNLNFNALLMLTPPEVIDSVVVHELCHLREMNHGARFYQQVHAVYPEYDRWDKWLKENGSAIMARVER